MWTLEQLYSFLAPVRAWNEEGGSAPLWLLLLAGLPALLAPHPALWRRMRVFVTVFHELGHALSGLLVGARVTGIKLHWNTSGVTHWSYAGSPGRLRSAWVAWWGYPAPSLTGGLGLFFLTTGYSRLFALFLVLLLLLVTVFWIRSLWGFVICTASTGLAGLVVSLSAPAASLLLALVSLFLVLGGVRTALEHLSDPPSQSDDSALVRKELFVPVKVVRYSFLLASVLFPLLLLAAALFLSSSVLDLLPGTLLA